MIAGFFSAARRSASGRRSTRTLRGSRAKNRLGLGENEMSIGRVCICAARPGAPRANCSSTRAITRGTFCGVAALSNRGKKVVGMACRIDSWASWSTRARVMSVA